MRNPLDLNNLPNDFIKDHSKQPLYDHSSSAASVVVIGCRARMKKMNGNFSFIQEKLLWELLPTGLLYTVLIPPYITSSMQHQQLHQKPQIGSAASSEASL
ncbi:hypothetical protein M8C21_002915 [Ambrosia artemisiifolia]|uniref:Uncharacterized protein n=1 Tax=Ambrosia artemisiifolia TaxID=4212 RepID=A0AAD5CX95_AMBAR|nr:hypothetical protein M8C21_002915 [Ambrosia artemisiifolia]